VEENASLSHTITELKATLSDTTSELEEAKELYENMKDIVHRDQAIKLAEAENQLRSSMIQSYPVNNDLIQLSILESRWIKFPIYKIAKRNFFKTTNCCLNNVQMLKNDPQFFKLNLQLLRVRIKVSH
jgi:hypothetical protein